MRWFSALARGSFRRTPLALLRLSKFYFLLLNVAPCFFAVNNLNALCPDGSGGFAFFPCYQVTGDMQLHSGIRDVEAVELLRFLSFCHHVVEAGICGVSGIGMVGKPERVAVFFQFVLKGRIALKGDCRMLRR